jgi:DNA replication initiation complex subunit (GINS family)
MDAQQMIELLLKGIRASREDFLAKLDVNQEKADVMLAKMDAWGEKMDAETRATEARKETIKARTAAMRQKNGRQPQGDSG